MKNFNRPSWFKAQRTGATHTHVDRTRSLTLTSTQLQPLCAKRQLTYYIIWNRTFILKVPKEGGGGANRRTRREPPTACPLICIT